jgi:hypothetical protein
MGQNMRKTTMAVAQIKGAEAATNSKGEAYDFTAIGQHRATIRVELETALKAVSDLLDDASEAIGLADETANKPAWTAAQALAVGLLDKSDFSEMLCQQFGRGPDTKAGKLSKTPIGYGLTIRKRAVCLSEAIGIAEDYNAGRDIDLDKLPKWTEGKSLHDIASVIAEVREGALSANTAYAELTKKAEGVSVKLHFDADKLTKLAAEIAKPENRVKIAESAALMAAYAALKLAIEGLDAPVSF